MIFVNFETERSKKMKLGPKIQQYRKKNQLSQEQLGEIVGVTRQTIANWEMGESCPDILQARALAQTFSISLDELLEYNTTDALISKVNHVQKFSTLSFGISLIHLILFLGVILFVIVLFCMYFRVHPTSEAVEISCHMNQQNYYYRLNLDYKTKEILGLQTNDEAMQERFHYQAQDDYEEVLSRIRDLVKDQGGTCD